MTFKCIEIAKAAGLEAGRQSGKEQLFRCPRHEDQHPSLSINAVKDIWMCGPCDKKGTAWQLAAFIGGVDPGDKPAVNKLLHQYGLSNGNGGSGNGSHPSSPKNHKLGRVVATYDYCDENGAVLYQVVRHEPKDFRQRRPDGSGGWIYNMEGVQRVPYRLPELREAVYVFIVEGEKDVENLRGIGLTATCNVGGAGKWLPEYGEWFRPHQCAVVMRDNDPAGEMHQTDVLTSLHGKVSSLKALNLPHLPPKGDVTDWLAMKDKEIAAEELARLADVAPEWNPIDTAPKASFEPPAHWKRLDLADLSTWECEPLRPIVDGIIARGNLVIVAASSQTGKTLNGIYLARKMLNAGKLYERYDITPINRVGYLVLEDPARRIQSRMLDTEHEFPPIEHGRLVFQVAPSFTLLDPEMSGWMESVIANERLDVLFIDTYQKATPAVNSFDDEQQSKVLHQLANLTRKLSVTIVVLDHIRKGGDGRGKRGELSLDDVKGSGAKVQNADVVILLERTADKKQLKFQAFSKDFDSAVRILLNVAPKGSDQPKFTYAADLEQLGSASVERAAANRQKVLEAMKCGEQYSVPKLAETVGLKRTAVQNHLKRLAQDGKVRDNGADGKYKRYELIATSQNGDSGDRTDL